MSERVDAVAVLTEGLWVNGFVPVSAVVVVAAIDPDTGQEFLFHRHDTDASNWKHIGMLTVVLDGMRAAFVKEGDTDGGTD